MSSVHGQPGGQYRLRSNCKRESRQRNGWSGQPAENLANGVMQKRVLTQFGNRRTPRSIAISLRVSEDAIWQFLLSKVGAQKAA